MRSLGYSSKKYIVAIAAILLLSSSAYPVCPAVISKVVGAVAGSVRPVADFIHAIPQVGKDGVRLLHLLSKLQQKRLSMRDPELRDLVIRYGGALQSTGKLPDILHFLSKIALKRKLFPPGVTEENLGPYVDRLAAALDAELSARGSTKQSRGVTYETWGQLSARLTREIQEVKAPDFSNPEFRKEFERQTGASFKPGNSVRLMIDGPKALEERVQMIEQAKDSVHLLSWAFYDDASGNRIADLLIKKHRDSIAAGKPIDIRVVVDGQNSEGPHHDRVIKKMERAGVPVMRWRSNDPARRYDGNHRKIMVVDGKESIEGGRNIGDEYFHSGSAEKQKWRDTEVRVKGPGVADASRAVVEAWNSGQGGTNNPMSTEIRIPPLESEGKLSSLVNHKPGFGENILRANLLAIEAAKESIDISNCYFIMDPAVYRALLRAHKRGVKVRVHTNSPQSIDVPEIGYMIMRSANHLAKNGMEVYLQKGDLLHSKYMNVDGNYSWVGSHNMFARSYRYEGEFIRTVLDSEFGAQMKEMFEQDIANAERLEKPIPIPKSLVGEVIDYWLFDQH